MKSPDRLRYWLALAALAPGVLQAQGFGVSEIGSCAVARAFATTASPCRDASAIYWNSAATTALSGWTISGGVAEVAIKGSFRQDTSGRTWNGNAPTQPVPHFFINYHPAESRAAYGFGVYVPYGLTSQWTNDFPGRFEAQKASLATFYFQPNFAWKLSTNWSIGGGPVFGHSSVELIQALDLSTVPTGSLGPTQAPILFGNLGIASGTEFATVDLKGSANAWGAQIGIIGQLTPSWSIGARFLSPLTFKYDGATATFTQIPTNLTLGADLPGTPLKAGTPVDAVVASQFASGGALVSQSASTTITHPAQLQAGAAYTGYKNWLLEADYAWVGWRRFGSLPVDFSNATLSKTLIEDYNNTSSIRLGAEYTIPTDGWKLRAGFQGIASAAPPETVTPLLPEQDRNYWNLGLGIPLMKMWTVDGSYSHVSTPGARGRIVERTQESQTAAQLNSGVYRLSANIFSLTIRANF